LTSGGASRLAGGASRIAGGASTLAGGASRLAVVSELKINSCYVT